MEKIILTSDSGVDPVDTEYMVPGLLIRSDGKNYRDVTEIDSAEVLRQSNEEHFLFKTSSPMYSDYLNVFKKAVSKANDVIHLSMGYGISQGSVNLSTNVANEVGNGHIRVVDSMSGATGGTLIWLYAKHLIFEGYDYETIMDKLLLFRKYAQTSFFVPNPVGFKRSGRDKSEMCLKDRAMVVGAQALKMAGVKFRVDFNDDGNLYTKNTMIGKSSSKAIQMIKGIVNDDTIYEYDNQYAVLGTVLPGEVDMKEIEDYLKNYFQQVVRQDINGVVAAYGSKDLIGLSLVKKMK
jgi:fatty acid-binding protein DegV